MGASGLFRDEALAVASDRSLGGPVALMPWSWWVLTGFLIAFAASTVVFLATATFPRKEAVAEVLQYSRGAIRVLAPKAGIVTSILVHDGQRVHVGEALAYVTTEQWLASGTTYDRRMHATVAQEIAALRDRRAALDRTEPLRQRAIWPRRSRASPRNWRNSRMT